MKRAVFVSLTILCLLSASSLTGLIQVVRAEGGTITINSDGSITPSTAPIYSADNLTYTFTGNISGQIVVQRNNIMVDGNGYTVQGYPFESSDGIELSSTYNVTIKNTNIKDSGYGIWLNSSLDSTVSGNNITDSLDDFYDGGNLTDNLCGVLLSFSSNSTISGNYMAGGAVEVASYLSSNNMICGNNITDNLFGIELDSSSNNTFYGNNITNSNGIELDSSPNNMVYGNNMTGQGVDVNSSDNNTICGNNITVTAGNGVWLGSSSNNMISDNNITADPMEGYSVILLGGSSNNTISQNIIKDNIVGVALGASSNNTISENIIEDNTFGIDLQLRPDLPSALPLYSSNNTIYHNNFINNQVQALGGLQNVWDNGYPSGGNFWNNYNGTDLYSGPGQNLTGSDGIGDTPYIIDSNNTDQYPLMNPYGFPIQQTTETVYINSNGSVTPSNAPISNIDNTEYAFEVNMNCPAYYGIIYGIVAERNNIIIDGNGYTVKGNLTAPLFSALQSIGLYLNGTSNVTVENVNIQGFYYGIYLSDSNNCTIEENNATTNGNGIYLSSSQNNTVSDNFAESNQYFAPFHNLGTGIYLSASNNNLIDENNATTNDDGIGLDSSSNNNTVSNNNATANYSNGIYISSSSDNTVSNNNAKANYNGIVLYNSSNNTINDNNAESNQRASPSYLNGNGIYLTDSSNNLIYENNITTNDNGIQLARALATSANNTIYHNNFIGNRFQVYIESASVGNTWDNGYPSGGNYWSDYNGTDTHSGPYQNVTGSDGIGDTPYSIDANNTDNYPLMGEFSNFNVSQNSSVQIVSNSTISDFQYNGKAILFNVSGANGTTGFCNMHIPTSLINGTLPVFINGTQVQYSLLPNSNGNQTYLYFTYTYSTEKATVPEFSSFLILPLFMIATLLALIIYKKKGMKRSKLDRT
jgi:parallel beta-helix repeat protein